MLISAALFAADDDGGRIVGQVVQQPCAPVSGALVRVGPDGGGPTLYRTQSAPDGHFALEHVKPDTYAVRISKYGHGQIRLESVVVATNGGIDLGRTWLDQLNCDAPGAHCGCVGDGCHDVLRDGGLSVKLSCSADLESGVAACDNGSRADIRFIRGEGNSLYVRPVNGATIAPVSAFEARDSHFSNEPIRIDGTSAGASFWVHTAGGHSYSHLTLTSDVEPDSAELELWYVNRRLPPHITLVFVDGLCPEDK
jgi:hypothetical protein